MKAVVKLSLATAAGALLLVGTAAKAQVNDAPITEKWFPTEFGADDKAGAISRITPDVIMKAVKLVKKGKSATLGKYYHSSIPGFGARSWNMQIPGTPTGGPFGRNALIYHDEFVQTELGQISTQFDGPGHIGVRTSQGDMMYNGRLREKVYERGAGGRVLGMGDAGVENVAEYAYVCRGVLLDAAAYKGWTRLPIPKDKDSPGIVTAADVKGIIAKEGIAKAIAYSCTRATETCGQTRFGKASHPPRKPRAAMNSSPANPASASALASTWPSARSRSWVATPPRTTRSHSVKRAIKTPCRATPICKRAVVFGTSKTST
jgi:hypothetical protein